MPISSTDWQLNEGATQLLAAAISFCSSWLETCGISATTSPIMYLQSSCCAELHRRWQRSEEPERSKTLLMRLAVVPCSTTCPSAYGPHLKVWVYTHPNQRQMTRLDRELSTMRGGGRGYSLSLAWASPMPLLPCRTE